MTARFSLIPGNTRVIDRAYSNAAICKSAARVKRTSGLGCYDVCVRRWAKVKRKDARKHKAQKTVMSPELPTISGTVNTNRYNDVPRTRRDLHRKAPIRPATAAATAVPWTKIKRNMTPAFVSVVPRRCDNRRAKGCPLVYRQKRNTDQRNSAPHARLITAQTQLRGLRPAAQKCRT